MQNMKDQLQQLNDLEKELDKSVEHAKKAFGEGSYAHVLAKAYQAYKKLKNEVADTLPEEAFLSGMKLITGAVLDAITKGEDMKKVHRIVSDLHSNVIHKLNSFEAKKHVQSVGS